MKLSFDDLLIVKLIKTFVVNVYIANKRFATLISCFFAFMPHIYSS